jgi:sortase A
MSNVPISPNPDLADLGLLRPGPAPPALSRSDLDSSLRDSYFYSASSRPPRRAWRALSWVLILLGALVLADVAVTLVWQEPLSALYARVQQDRLSGALRQVERAQPTFAERQQLALLAERQRVAFLARRLQRHAGGGSPVGSIHIPRIGANFVVVAGTGVSELEKGPGIYPETSFPGVAQTTTAIAGHRTTWLAPFRHIDELHTGNHILLYMPYAHFTYTVTSQRVVLPSDVAAAVDPVGYPRLVLSACTPLFSAAKRLLVFARLTRTVPVGAARVATTSGAPIPPGGALGRSTTAPPLAAPAGTPPAPARPT